MPEDATPSYPDFTIPAASPREGYAAGRCITKSYAARAKLELAVVNLPEGFTRTREPGHAATASLTPSKPVAPVVFVHQQRNLHQPGLPLKVAPRYEPLEDRNCGTSQQLTGRRPPTSRRPQHSAPADIHTSHEVQRISHYNAVYYFVDTHVAYSVRAGCAERAVAAIKQPSSLPNGRRAGRLFATPPQRRSTRNMTLRARRCGGGVSG